MNDKIIEEFINHFQTLSENEKYALGKLFNEKTGGRLSQHNNPISVAVAMIVVEDNNGQQKLLGIKRGIPPHIGGLAFPGGFQEENESAVGAAVRELFEETGLNTNVEDYEIFGSPLPTHNNNQLIFFKNKKIFNMEIMSELVLTNEVQGFELIDQETTLCFPLHEQKAKDFFKETLILKDKKIIKQGLK